MMIKYRVSEVAKDFGVPSKDVIELLANRSSSEIHRRNKKIHDGADR